MITVGVLIGSAGSPHTVSLMQGIQEAASHEDVNLQFFLAVHTGDYYHSVFGKEPELNRMTNYDYQFNVVYDYACNSMIDILIIAYGSVGLFLEEDNIDKFLSRFEGIPYVIMEDFNTSPSGSDIITDNYSGMHDLVEHMLLKHHCRKICFLSGPKGNRDAEERLQAVRDALGNHHLPFEEEQIAYGDYSTNVGAQAERLLSQNPDAIVCADDMMASTVYERSKAKGLTIGKDILVTGFDDDPNLSLYFEPPITTVRQDAFRMGQKALQCAIAWVRDRKSFHLKDPAELVIRSSCGCEESDRSKDTVTNYNLLKQFGDYKKVSYFMALISQDMIRQMQNGEEEFYKAAVNKLPALGVKSAYLYLGEPKRHLPGEAWVCPKDLSLKASLRNGKAAGGLCGQADSYAKGIRIVPENMRKSHYSVCCFPLFSGEWQYGLFVAEISVDNLVPVFLATQQICVALEFSLLEQHREAAQKQMEEMNVSLNHKNEILNSLSMADPLTGCFNRRGFMEKGIEFIQEHKGESAIVYFSDIDRLKEINDHYGHAEGDYSIRTAAKILLDHFSRQAIIGRIGGDEFVIIGLYTSQTFPGTIIEEIRSKMEQEAESDGKPFYLDMSFGYIIRTCSEEISLTYLLNEADQLLYVDKKDRRHTIARPHNG